MKDLFKKKSPDQVTSSLGVKIGETPPSHTISALKVYSIITFSTAAAVASSYYFSSRLFAYGTVALLTFLVIAVVQAALLRGAIFISTASTLNALGLSLFLYQVDLGLMLVSTLTLGLMFSAANWRGRREIDNMVKIRFFRSMRATISILLVAITVFSGFILFVNGSTLLEDKNVGKFIDVVGKPIFSDTIPDFSSDMKLEDALGQHVETQIGKEVDLSGLSEYQRELTLRQAKAAFLKDFTESTSATFQYEPKLDQSIAQNIQSFVSAKTEFIYQKTQVVRLLILLLVLVITIKSIEFLLNLPIALLAFVIYELLIAFGFVVVQFESRSKEVLKLP